MPDSSQPLRKFVTSARWSQAIIFAVIMIVAVGSASFINQFRDMADESRRAELSIAKLEVEANHLAAAEWQSIGTHKLTKDLTAQLFESRRRISDRFAKISVLSESLKNLKSFKSSYSDYVNAVDHEFNLLNARRFDEAERWDEEMVSPAYDQLSDQLTKTSADAGKYARATMAKVRMWTFGVFAASGLIISCLLVLFAKRNRAVHRAQIEQDLLRESNAELEIRVRLRTTDLEASNRSLAFEIEERKQAELDLKVSRREAERANDAKSDFLSRMSHELRTPLNAVIGYAQLLEMRSQDPKTLESAESILKGGRHLLSLVNEVLDMARIESGKLSVSVEPVSVSHVVSQAIDMVRLLATEREVTILNSLNLNDTTHVLADRQRMLQVFINVLSNAIKYNRPHGRIEISQGEGSNGYHRIEIHDSGIGITEEQSQKLFVPFERVNSNQAEGAGLGLALSRRMMRLMNGELLLLASSPDGSTFGIDLKATEAFSVESEFVSTIDQTPPTATAEKFRIIYIEDNLPNLQLMASILADIPGVELMSAMEAGMGMVMIESHLPDLILLDLHLPNGNGYDVLTELKERPETAKIPVIVISSDATDSQLKRLMEAGAQAYITKPIDIPALISELDRARTHLPKAA